MAAIRSDEFKLDAVRGAPRNGGIGRARPPCPQVAAGLVGTGYRLAAGLFTAAEVGAPHKRERLFILAIREGDELADPARLLWDPVEWWEQDGTAAALADTPRQCQREPADETDAVAGGWAARHEPRDDGCDVADADG